MYLDFFRLKEKPFNVTPDPNFLYMSPSHEEAFATLLYGVRERKGFIMITGEVGTGKTTLVHNLLENLDEKTQSIFVFHTGMDFIDFLETIHHELNISFEARTRASMLQSLNRYLIEQLTAGFNTVLIIDEAQNLSAEILENLRLLSNLETAKEKLLQIVLVGQLELEEKMDQPELRQLRQRITVQSRIAPLNVEESRAYIRHRLEVASDGPRSAALFSEEALSLICHQAQGIPRQLNVLCDNALLIAYAEGNQVVETRHVRETLRDRMLGGRRPPKRRPRPEPAAEPEAPARARPSFLRVFAVIGALLVLAVLAWGSVRLDLPARLKHEWSARAQRKEAASDLLPAAPAGEPPGPAPAANPLEADGALADSGLITRSVDRARALAESLLAAGTSVDSGAAQEARPPATKSSGETERPGSSALDAPARKAAEAEAPLGEAAGPAVRPPVETTAPAASEAKGRWVDFPGSVPDNPAAGPLNTEAVQATAEPRDREAVQPAPEPWDREAVQPAPEPRDREAVQSDSRTPSSEAAEPIPAVATQESGAEALPPAFSEPDSTLSDLQQEIRRAQTRLELKALLDRCKRTAYIVRPGEAFSGIVRRSTGRNDPLALELLREMNPHIRDFGHIEAGWVLYVPEFKEQTD